MHQTEHYHDTTKSNIISPIPAKVRNPYLKNKKGHKVKDTISPIFDPRKISFLS